MAYSSAQVTRTLCLMQTSLYFLEYSNILETQKMTIII